MQWQGKERITSSPWGFRYYDWDRYCAFMHSIGITNLCGMFVNPDALSLSFSDDMNEQKLNEILSISQRNGVQIIEVAGVGDYTKANIAEQIDVSRRQIDVAAKLGAKYFRLVAAWMVPEDTIDGAYAQVAKALTEVANHAGQYGITIAVENHGGITATGERVEQIFQRVEAPNVGVNYDPANFLFYGEDPLAALERIMPYVVFTHIKDCKTGNGKPRYCRIGEGDVDYVRILSYLAEHGYDGFYGLEYENENDVEQGTQDDLKTLGSLLARVSPRLA